MLEPNYSGVVDEEPDDEVRSEDDVNRWVLDAKSKTSRSLMVKKSKCIDDICWNFFSTGRGRSPGLARSIRTWGSRLDMSSQKV